MTPKEAYKEAVSTGIRSRGLEKVIAMDAEYSRLYARHFLKGPFPAGEKSIMKEPFQAFLYCKDVIGQRWYDAEGTIMKNPHAAYRYALEIIGGRWEDAEKHIMKSATWAGAYAEGVLKGRFRKAEDAIASEEAPAEDYFHCVIRGKWRDWSEDEICRSASWMYYYARCLGYQLPEPLHSKLLARRRKSKFADMYFKEFCQ